MPQVEYAQDGEWFPSALPEDSAVNAEGVRSVAVLGRFIWAKILDIQESKAQDKECYKRVAAIEHKARSHTSDVSVTKISPDNSKYWVTRFPDAWLAFQGEEVEIDGTPLTAKNDLGHYVIEDMNPDRAKILRLQGVRTIEELSKLTDHECESMGFGYKLLRKTALDHLKPEKEKRPVGRPRKEINAELEALEATQRVEA